MIELTAGQQQIADSIIASDSPRTTLAGLAGTGKTTLVKVIYDAWREMGLTVRVVGPTGKSAMVLSSKGVPATTLHRAIYHYRGKIENDNGDVDLIFKDNKEGRFCDRLIVDEASMITARQLEDIEARDVQTLWVGDPGQLPPVKSRPTGLFTRPTHILREIHRQAAGNPIIEWAYKLRKGSPLAERHPGIRFIECAGRGPTFVAAKMMDLGIDRLIVKTNAQRVALNSSYRTLQNRKGNLCEGDEIICVANNRELGVVNGEVFRVDEVRKTCPYWTEAELTGIDTGRHLNCMVAHDQFGQEKRIDTDELDADLMVADHAYAITCHKFQGSSTRHAGIVDKGYCGDDARRWNYTAATRAEQEVTVFH